MLVWPLNPIYTQIPNSLTSIIWGQTNFPSLLTTISGFLNRCFFDLSTRFVLIFGLPDLDYPGSDQVSTIVGHHYEFLKPMFFWPQMQTNTHTTYFFSYDPPYSRGNMAKSLLYYSPIPLIHNSTIPLIHNSTIPLIRNSTIPLIHNSTIPLIHNSTIPLFAIPLDSYINFKIRCNYFYTSIVT